MDSFDHTTHFRYNPNADTEGDTEFSGVLELYVHHARNLHNICIYENQDVYAKFSLTYDPDETLSTGIINGGGKNPDFNENLVMKVTQSDAVLKCEIWMLSRAKVYMEDQLLGFALVPLSLVIDKGRVSQEFSLSSTDLFHSPAGTIKLTLSMTANVPHDTSTNNFCNSVANSSISSEIVLLDRKISEVVLDPTDYSRIEFPDVDIVRENQKMVSEYFDAVGRGSVLRPGWVGLGSFLHLGASHQLVDDYEMAANSSLENRGGSASPNGSIQNSGFLSSTITSISDDRNSVDSMEKKNHLAGDTSNSPNLSVTTEANQSPSACPETPTSKQGNEVGDEKEPNFSGKEEESNKEGGNGSIKYSRGFSAPLGNINLEVEPSAIQQQIVDMYMRSMQQFTQSLAKMKLPMDMDKPEAEDRGDVIQDPNKAEFEKKKDGSRVYYGSRAFF
ncbi:hypothetical protein RJ639_021521 [Escallonia herrerae]|uniref:C2 domain-containing protein n=1 Tax=Escallonia herrerae TaxID=1293975 RepID=A0AA89AFG6_9ASTE|nr:hypothetical protein RJ639_021521 [Escallonia herrerae]